MEPDKKSLSEDEKFACAKAMREFTQESNIMLEGRASELSNEFIRLEVQIATILFAVVGFVISSFGEGKFNFLWAKATLCASVFFLISSLVMGLLHLKREEKFLDGVIYQRVTRIGKWKEVLERKTSFEEASAFQLGSRIGAGATISTPMWTWVLQTIFLVLGTSTLFVLFVTYIFR